MDRLDSQTTGKRGCADIRINFCMHELQDKLAGCKVSESESYIIIKLNEEIVNLRQQLMEAQNTEPKKGSDKRPDELVICSF